jgi:lysophospholipase L1-like esterase
MPSPTLICRRALLGAVPLLTAPRLTAAGRLPLAASAIARMQTPWWRRRHAAKLAELRRQPPALVFLGDSITQNWERSGPPPWQDFQPAWRHFYGDRRAVNLGFTGDATCHLLWRIENGELDHIAPRAAVILIGANNLGHLHWPTPDDVAGITAVVDATRRRQPQAAILLLGILPSDRSDWASATTRAVNAALAARYRPGGNPTFMDLAALFAPDGVLDRALFYDPLLTPPAPPLHPTAQAQARLAAAIEPTLARLLGDSPRPPFGVG